MIQTILWTLSSVWLYIISRMYRNVKTVKADCKKLVDDIANASNTNAESMENLIRKVQDLEARIAMQRVQNQRQL